MNTAEGSHTAHARALDPGDRDWQVEQEGQLAIDVLETKEHLIVLSTLAGASSETIEVTIHNDLLTIRGERKHPLVQSVQQTYYQECFWGRFSRTVVLPVDVKGDLAQAEYTNGVLLIRIPKRDAHRRIPVIVVDE